MLAVRDAEVGNYIKDSNGNEYQVLAVYNKMNAAHQLLLEGEVYPMLVSELVKLGYTFSRRG